MENIRFPFASRHLPPAPSVPESEQNERVSKLQREMAHDGIDFLVLSDKKNVEYLTSYHSLSWGYNSRPLFTVVSSQGVTLIGSLIEEGLLASIERSFSVTLYDGYLKEAAIAIANTIQRQQPTGSRFIAIDYGQDMLGRGSIDIIDELAPLSKSGKVVNGAPTIWRIRKIKSDFEADLKRVAFGIVNDAFDHVISKTSIGVREYELAQKIQAQINLYGAETANQIAMLFSDGDFFYGRPPSSRKLRAGHYVWTDFRATYGGYPADRNRIARAGDPEAWEVDVYRDWRALTIDLAQSVKPGMTCADVYNRFVDMWAKAKLGKMYSKVSRIGHGGGLDVTEPPSLSKTDDTVIESGMILHIEPKLERDGAIFQFEEVIYVTDDGISFLSNLSPESIPIIQ